MSKKTKKNLEYPSNAIEANEKDYLYIAPSQISNAGEGLYTAIKIFKDEAVSYFKGEILTEKQIQKRVDANEDQYFISMLDGTIMDSKRVKCYAKYANDAAGISGSSFKNNAKITIDEDNNVCLTATKNIKPNEEVFCDYGKRYWKKFNG
jgi:uncharacterized protein